MGMKGRGNGVGAVRQGLADAGGRGTVPPLRRIEADCLPD